MLEKQARNLPPWINMVIGHKSRLYKTNREENKIYLASP